ncbi:hypothetical protein [Peribacillus cavernae]|nr:hypothetical protein [Peribacillus cavernae]MDQ0220705.1 hypothetical protein [Peribacillus cavernae]
MDVVTFGETMVFFVPTKVAPLRFTNQFETNDRWRGSKRSNRFI